MKVKRIIYLMILVLIESCALVLPIWMTNLYVIYIGSIKNKLLSNSLSVEIPCVIQSSIFGLFLVCLWIGTLVYLISDLKKLIFHLRKLIR